MFKYGKIGFILIALLLWLPQAVADEGDFGDCNHIWCPYDHQVHEQIPVSYSLFEVDATCHLYMKSVPHQVCAECGMCEYLPQGGTYGNHAYKVISWNYISNGTDVQVSMVCDICAYEQTVIVSIQSIVEGTNNSCLWGAKCDERTTSYIMKDGVVYSGTLPFDSETDESDWFVAIVYYPDSRKFQCLLRKYCTVCGRPSKEEITFHSEFNENWNGLPIMTEDYFLTVDMPDNLPYQLIDQLRQEAEAA